MSYNLNEEKNNVQSPLTKQLMDKIESDFVEKIDKTNYDGSVKSHIISLYRKTAKKTTDDFIIKLITDAVKKPNRRKNRGRRETDGL